MRFLLLFILFLVLPYTVLYCQEVRHNLPCYDAAEVEALHIHKWQRNKSNEHPRVGIYYEVDYQSYLDHNQNLIEVTDWIEGLFTEVKSIYALHDIDLYIADIFIWQEPDIYHQINSIDSILGVFGTRLQDDFLGHVAQLCTTRLLGGGKGILNGICHPYDADSKKGPYSIATSISTETHRDPSYSWSVFIMAHELGHVLGSPHTQACFWGPHGNEPLDDCFVTEGDCTTPSDFSGAGTIMSYCFMQSNGVDFALGLGAEPGNYIYNNLQSKTCLSSCEGFACNDNDPCTMNDTMDEYCNCKGELLDINENSICDMDEPCDSLLVLNQLPSNNSGYIARDAIMNYSAIADHANVTMSAGEEIQFMPGASISNNSTFSAYLYGCKKDE